MGRWFVVLFCVLAAGCQSALVSETGPLSITSVSVRTAPGVVAESDIATKVQREASTQVIGHDPSGKPVRASVEVTRVRYKNPGASFFIGDANSITSTVTLTEPNGRVVSQFDLATQTDAQIQGIIGLALAAAANRQRVDDGLAKAHGGALRQRIYGSQPRATPAPAPATAQPQPASGPPTS